jgi:pyruvate/2-oxoglutarate/acetoin dehydrogenase E1 component
MALPAPVGETASAGAAHASGSAEGGLVLNTQSIEGILNNVPGIRIVAPSNARMPGALWSKPLRRRPVIFLEHRSLYDVPAEEEDGLKSAGAVRSWVQQGDAATIVAWVPCSGSLVRQPRR